MTTKLNKTKIFKSLSGDWIGQTFNDVNGVIFKIETTKRGRKLHTSSTPAEVGTSGHSVSFDDMINTTTTILEESCQRVTEKAITEHHAKALLTFDEMAKNNKIKGANNTFINKPAVKHILFLDGYGQTKGDHGNKHVIYKIEQTNFAENYHTVELDTLELGIQTRPRNFAKKFGIGYYFTDDYIYTGSETELNDLLIDAHELKAKNDKKEIEAAKEAERLDAETIERGKQIVSIPDWAKSVIVAELFQNDSDIYTDYFATKVTDIVILGFSKSARNNMQELKKFAQNFDETKDLTGEHTDGHSYLPDYYLGSEQWSGWKVSKDKHLLFDLKKIYRLAGAGKYLVKEETAPKATKAAAVDGVEYVDYSPRAFAIIGDTKPIKDELKELGGKFNPRLKCGAGWIFSKAKSEKEVKDFLNIK